MDDGEPRFLTTGEAAKHVWNYDCLLDETLNDEPLIITEGRADALAAIQSGFPRTISVPGGAVEAADGENRASQYKFVATLERELHPTKVRRIVLATDADGPGEAMRDELARRLGRGRCQWIERPAGCKDFNDMLLGYGEGSIQDAVRGAQWLHVNGGYLPSTLPPRTRQRAVVSGMPGLDDKYRVRRGDLSIVTGWPGSGKSTWINDFASRMAVNHGWCTLFASFEQPPQTQHMWNLRQWHLGKTPDEMTQDDVRKADEWIETWARFVIPDDEEDTTMEWVFEIAATMILRHNVDMVVVDPFNELEIELDRDNSMTNYIRKMLKRVKRFADQYGVHFVIAAHPSKIPTKAHDELPEPRLDQIEDSRHWWGKADVGVILHPMAHADGYKYTQCRIGKSKVHQEIGKPGVVGLSLNTTTQRYHEIAV
jgi:twinkle protein